MTKKVLIADDSPTIQKFISLALADEDISVENVSDGEQAVERVKSSRPELVMADILMPGINGYELCSIIKEDPELVDTQVILMAGTFESFDEEAAKRAGCDAHLTKPFDTSELIQLVHSLMPDSGEQYESNKYEGTRELWMSESTINGFGIKTGPALVSPKTKDSFMGSGRILELFTEKDVMEARSARRPTQHLPDEKSSETAEVRVTEMDQSEPQEEAEERTATPPQVQTNIQASSELPDEVVDRIVEKVVRRMSQEVIREIAWEVVPELSEVIIRQRLEELENKS